MGMAGGLREEVVQNLLELLTGGVAGGARLQVPAGAELPTGGADHMPALVRMRACGTHNGVAHMHVRMNSGRRRAPCSSLGGNFAALPFEQPHWQASVWGGGVQ